MVSSDGDYAIPDLLRISISKIEPHSSGRCLVTIEVTANDSPNCGWDFQTIHDYGGEDDVPAVVAEAKRQLAEMFSNFAKVLSGPLPAVCGAP